MKLKTLNEIPEINTEGGKLIAVNKLYLRKEVIRWIKSINKKNDEHWKKLNKYGYVDFPGTKNEDAYSFQLEGMRFGSWHEDSNVSGAIMILKHIFNIKKKDLRKALDEKEM